MNKDLLFEIGTEEMPAVLMPGVLSEFRNTLEREFASARLSWESIWIGGTPRRLGVIVRGIPKEQAELLKEARGPRAAQAFDAGGNPTKALEGFARGQGIKVEDVVIREVGDNRFVYAITREKGQAAALVLPGLLKQIVLKMPLQRSMRWGYSETRFIRPIRWMLSIFGGEVVPVEIENVHADRWTFGHRFLSPEAIAIEGCDDYVDKLRDAYVLVDVEERRHRIWGQVQQQAAKQGGQVLTDDKLLEEVTFLVEFPTAFTGRFASEYLSIPSEVLVTTMKEHQRYFPVVDSDSRLMPVFIGVRNGTGDHIEEVAGGNERVLKARLEDAHFFFREDSKRPLETKVELLKNVIYQARLGTVWAKTERLRHLSKHIAGILHFKELALTDRAAQLCKADLETNMVYEFPELQGMMGRSYALIDGEDPIVAQAIYEHYLPRFAGDDIPATEPGVAVSLAEKFDNLIGNFAIGVKPSGSQDPYALRRQAMGIVAIVTEARLKVDLEEVIRRSYREFQVPLDLSEDETVSTVMEFIRQRFRGVLIESGLTYDVIDAAMAYGGPDLVMIREKALALAAIKEEPFFEDLMVVFNRTFNLSAKAGEARTEPEIFIDEAENKLYQGITDLEPELRRMLEEHDYISYCRLMAAQRPILDDFFEKIMVMVDDQSIRDNRLALLKMVVEKFAVLGDLSKIVP